jgi:hypothetical protein
MYLAGSRFAGARYAYHRWEHRYLRGAPPLPEHLADLFDRPEKFEVCPNDFVTVRGRIEEILDQS